MPDFTAPTLELEAVNDMLSAIGESPVATLDDPPADAEVAIRLLRMESRALQAEGWHFNTSTEVKLLPNGSGEFELPANTLKVDTSGSSANLDLVNRGGKLYDPRKQTFVLTGLSSVTVDMVLLLDFEAIPEAARTYVRIKAGRKFLARSVGTQDTVGYELKDEKDARAGLEVEEESTADRSLFQNPDYFRLMPQRSPSLWA